MLEKAVDSDQNTKESRMWQNFSFFPYRLTSYVNDLLALKNILKNSSSESLLKNSLTQIYTCDGLFT